MTRLPATVTVLALLGFAALAQYVGTVAFLSAFPPDSPLPGAVRVVEVVALLILGPGAGTIGRSLGSNPSTRSRLRVLVGVEAPPSPPIYPDIPTFFPQFLRVIAVIAGWWALFAASVLVIPVRIFESHWLWVAGIEIVAPIVAIAGIVGVAQPLFTPLPAPKPGRII
jgi:hypothetical protein